MTASSSSFNTRSERTEVVYGTENTTNVILNFLYNAEAKMDICADSIWPSVAMGIDVFKKALINIKDRGIRSRYVTDITRYNLPYCKEAMKFGELRHLDGIKGNFAVSEKEYMASATMQEAELLQQVIYSNVKEVLEQQQYVFDSFWKKSVAAENRIREIEEGVASDVIEVIQNASRAKTLYFEVIKSAKEEVLVIFPTPNAFIRQEKLGVIQAIIEVSGKNNLKVRILMPAHNISEHSLRNLKRCDRYHNGNIDVRYIEVTSGTKATILLADRKLSLVMELKDDSKDTFDEAIGLSTYSNSRPGVLSYVSIFENLWKQTELYEQVKDARDSLAQSNKQLEEANEQLKIHDKMQKEFINVAAHELRTPIQPIISSVGILRSRKGNIKVQELDNSLDTIARSAQRLKQLSSDILDVTKIESHSLDLEREQFNLNEVLSNTVEDYKKQITKFNIDIKLLFIPYEHIIIVEADRYRIIQVISNILNNAIKFTRKRGGIVTVEAQKKNNEIKNNQAVAMVSIKDTGSGIDPDIMPRLFEKFAAKSFQGTGLGLFISKNIIEAHGGKIWAENNNDNNADGGQNRKGAIFYFTLPIVSNQNKTLTASSMQKEDKEEDNNNIPISTQASDK
jgi:two-component system, OmpR family, sensor histidine kinase VicK